MQNHRGKVPFSGASVHEIGGQMERDIANAVAALKPEELLGTATEQWVDYLMQEHGLDVPDLDFDGITVETGETNIPVSRQDAFYPFGDAPTSVTGTRLTYDIPITGDGRLLVLRPSSLTYLSGTGHYDMDGDSLTVTYSGRSLVPGDIQRQFDRALEALKGNLVGLRRELMGLNDRLRQRAHDEVEQRRQRLLSDRGVAEQLGYPLRKRADAGKVTAYQLQRKRLAVSRPKATPAAPPEPVLAMEEYEQILSIIENMALVMERSPRAFQTMREEDLRQHFLVQLNGTYEGEATGETFNFNGKTDILVRAGDRNIFIAECKFWSGPSSLTGAIDQLLGYSSWRDTKVAILVFNRDRNLSETLKNVASTLATHPNAIGQPKELREAVFRTTLRHRDDPERELILTVMVFEIPAPPPAS